MTTGSEMLLDICRVPEPQGTDEEIVREALAAYQRFMAGHQFGLLAYQFKLSQAALAAFERLVNPQPALFREQEG